jgi:transcriptional regulator with XRE-family HTH domain
MKQLGDVTPTKVKALRARRGWTQVQLAKALGTDAGTVSRWERGVSDPRPSARARLAKLGVVPAPLSTVRFVEDPEVRLRKLERALREQLDFKRRVRFVR